MPVNRFDSSLRVRTLFVSDHESVAVFIVDESHDSVPTHVGSLVRRAGQRFLARHLTVSALESLCVDNGAARF